MKLEQFSFLPRPLIEKKRAAAVELERYGCVQLSSGR